MSFEGDPSMNSFQTPLDNTNDTVRPSVVSIVIDDEEQNRRNSFEKKSARILELTKNVENLLAEKAETRAKLAQVEGRLAEAVQILQQEKYADDNIKFDIKTPPLSPTTTQIPRRSLPPPNIATDNSPNTLPRRSLPPPRSATPAPSSGNNSFSRFLKSSAKEAKEESKEEATPFRKSILRAKTESSAPVHKQVYTELDAVSETSDQADTLGPLNLITRRINSGMSESSDMSGFTDINMLSSRRNSFSSIRPKTLERNFSFSVDGMTEAEVQEHMIAMTPGHHRTAEEVEHKIVTIRRDPSLLEEPHEETFFELFYDLILVVVFIKLSYLKYEFTGMGLLTVAAVFSNFWSCWSLMNCYATMLHTEDMIHRAYYVAHITASFIMAITIDHPSYDFFNYQTMAQYHAAASILCRCITLVMWAYAYNTNLEASRDDESLYIYSHRHIRKQIGVHFTTIFSAALIFAFTMVVPWAYAKETEEDNMRHTLPTACLWLLAVAIEQGGSSIGSVYMKLPFPAIYAGSRMQAWLMLCFGESVIGLLIEPIFYQASQLGSLISAFFMILALCTVYFDIVDADSFLHLFITRKERLKAFLFMNFQLPFSFSVFLGGVALKNIMFISSAVFELEADYGCNNHQANSGSSSSYGYASSYSSSYGSSYSGAYSSYSRRQLSLEEEVALHGRMLGGTGGSGFTVLELDTLLFKSFLLLTFSFSGAMVSSILIGYAMPMELPIRQVHLSRMGAVVISLMTILVPYNLKSIATPCLGTGDDADDYEGYNHGLSLMAALVTTSMIMILGFFVALGSLDPNREETYHKLEVEAHYELTKKALKHRVSRRKNVFMDFFETAVTGITDITDTIADNLADITESIAEHIPTVITSNIPGLRQPTTNEVGVDDVVPAPVARKRRASVRKQERQAKKEEKAKLVNSLEVAKTEWHGREKKTVPQDIGRLGQTTESSKNRQKDVTIGAAELQTKSEKNARKTTSETLKNAKLEYESRDKVTKTQDIGSLGKLTEATKNRKSAATVENVGATEMQSRNQNKSRAQTSQALSDAKSEWEKRRKVTKPKDIGRLGQQTEASRNGRYIEPVKSPADGSNRSVSPMKSPKTGSRSKSPAGRSGRNTPGSARNKSPTRAKLSSRSKSQPLEANSTGLNQRTVSMDHVGSRPSEIDTEPISSPPPRSVSLDDAITSNDPRISHVVKSLETSSGEVSLDD